MTSPLCSAVIDVGSSSTKCGFSGEEAPRATFTSCVGVPRHVGLPGTLLQHRSDISAGAEAFKDRGLLHLRRPVRGGKIVDYDALEELLYYTLYSRLQVQPEQSPVLFVAPADLSRPSREKVAELFFESFSVPLCSFLSAAAATVYATGRTTGVSVDSGAGRTTVAAVTDGYTLTHSMRTSLIAGDVLTDELFRCLQEKGYPLSTEMDWEMVNRAKEALCRVSTDLADDQRQLSEGGPRLADSFALPDDERLFLCEHQFMVPERLFDPTLVVDEYCRTARPRTPTGYSTPNAPCWTEPTGWTTMIEDVIAGSPAVVQDELYGSVVLGGGTSVLRDLEKRLQKELVHRCGNVPPVRCIAFPERAQAAWVGGSVWSCGPNFAHACTAKADYDENGPNIVHHTAF